MSELLHKYNPGDHVWVKNDSKIQEGVVCRAVFEIDPAPLGVTEEKLYHLDIADDARATIILRAEELVYETASDALTETPPSNPVNSIGYDFNVGDTVWTYVNYMDTEAKVKQITIKVSAQSTQVIYHLLDINGEYSTLFHDSSIVFATQQEALDAIAKIITPTPTISITATVTPTATPAITPTGTPEITPTQTVTPATTVTPTLAITATSTVTPTVTSTVTPTVTPTPSPIIDGIMDSVYNLLLDAAGNTIEEADDITGIMDSIYTLIRDGNGHAIQEVATP